MPFKINGLLCNKFRVWIGFVGKSSNMLTPGYSNIKETGALVGNLEKNP